MSPFKLFQQLLFLAALLVSCGSAWAAQVVGSVARLSGPLMAKKVDGSIKVLGLRSEIESGDTLVSEKNTYAQIKFIDNSEITLRPGTTFKVENFAFEDGKPEADNASFSLVKGGLRSITGLMGKRNKEKFSLKTPNATIGIRGTTFVAQYVPPMPVRDEPSALADLGGAGGAGLEKAPGRLRDPASAPGVPPKLPFPGAPGTPPAAPALPPGLHLQVSDGMIIVTNNGGSQNFAAGQFGYVPNVNQPPVIVPNNPGLQFAPPPKFNAPAAEAAQAGTMPQDQNAVDCVVR